MKRISVFLVSLFLVSCGVYFGDSSSEKSGGAVDSLAVKGGGYISSDDHNEITPFVYRDSQTGKAWLLFASDRSDGAHYNIYAAEMYSDGTFASPVMISSINPDNIDCVFSPVVCDLIEDTNDDSVMETNRYLTFIRTNSEISQYEIMALDASLRVDQSIAGLTIYPEAPVSRIGLMQFTYGNSPSLLAVQMGNVSSYYWGSSAGWISNDSFYMESDDGFASANGYSDGEASYRFILTRKADSQLCSGYGYMIPIPDDPTWLINSVLQKGYRSVYHDCDGMIDLSSGKVYFASDRNGRGNYDLYRYNQTPFSISSIQTNAAVIDRINYGEAVEQYNLTPVVSWTAVEGADSYNIYCMRGGAAYSYTDYEFLTNVKGTNYTEVNMTNVYYDGSLYYMVRAKNSSGLGQISLPLSGYYPSTTNWRHYGTFTNQLETPGVEYNITNGASYKDIYLSWSAVSGAIAYEVYLRQQDNNDDMERYDLSNYTKIAIVTNLAYTYRMTEATKYWYYYKVVAVNYFTNSEPTTYYLEYNYYN